MSLSISVANEDHLHLAEYICQLMQEAAEQRGTGIAKRSSEYIESKIKEGKAVIALEDQELAGFCYIETWSHEKYVANSGLIVHPDHRGKGLGKRIKHEVFKLSRKKYPDAKIFGITTSLATMKINAEIGYKPVTFSELSTDEAFWNGCKSCRNYDILTRTNRSHCLCTGMLYDPVKDEKEGTQGKDLMREPAPSTAAVIADEEQEEHERWQRFKRYLSVNSWIAKKKIAQTIKSITL